MPLSKRKLKSMATHERIRSVALTLMRSHSIDEISVQDICTLANVGIGTFYHYYQNKDDIVHEVYSELDSRYLVLLEESISQDITPYEYLLRHFACYAKMIAELTPGVAKKMYALQSPLLLRKERPFYSTLRSFLLSARERGRVSTDFDVDEFCTYVNLCLRGIAYDWCLQDCSYDLVEASLSHADRVLAGYKEKLCPGSSPS